jgi:pimeloyl-ACP methyl ester carboxylesterase
MLVNQSRSIAMAYDHPLAPGTHDVVVDGVPLRYHVAGEGPVCVMHSGGPGIDASYLRMPEVERSVTAVYLEPIGTGKSGRLPGHPHGYTIDRYSYFVAKLIEHLGEPRVYFLGHSHGGFVGQHYALAHPDRVAGLILYDSAPTNGTEVWADVGSNVEAFGRRYADLPESRRVLEAWKSLTSSGVWSDEEQTEALREVFPMYFAEYWLRETEFSSARDSFTSTYVDGAGFPFDNRGKFVSFAVPTLLVVGRYDFICGPRWAKVLHDEIVGSELVVLEHSGHFGHVEEAECFAAAVARFVG